MKPTISTPRKQLSRWAGWFFFANTILLLLVGLSYIPALPNYHSMILVTFHGEVMAGAFAVFAFIGQFALFAYAACALAILFILCYPKQWFAFTIGILLASAAVVLLVADAIVFHLYHYHLAGLVWNILMSGVFSQVIVLSMMEWLLAGLLALGLFLLECGLAFWIWRKIQSSEPKRYGRFVTFFLVASFFLSYALYLSIGLTTSEHHSITARINNHLIVMEARIIPYYTDILSKIVPGEKNFQKLVNRNNGYLVQDRQVNKLLHYPLHPLTFKMPKKLYNIVIVSIDSWRFDMMNKTVTPNIAKFAKQAWVFSDHYSGGNSTQPGIFSLFYGIPANYWTAMLDQHRGPVFMRQLIKDHYQIGTFGSASLEYPAFDKTVFRDVKNLQVDTPGNDASERDKNITAEFKQFVKNRNTRKPFFSFLFYDAAHSYCEMGATFPKPFQPEITECDRVALSNDANPLPYINRYKNAVLYDDNLVGQVLHALKKQQLLKDTIVIITGDHGEEFNDEHLYYWGHASAFDPYQVRTPLIVYWPGGQPKVIHHQTSHYDIVPSLMTKALGCTSPISDYSVGSLLLSKPQGSYLLVGSYVDFAVLQKNRSTIIYPGGNYDVTYPNGHVMLNAKPNPMLLEKVYQELNRYFW